MNINITLRKGNNTYNVTEINNDIVKLKQEANGNNFKLTLIADEDIYLDSAVVSYDQKYSLNDLIFVNGYQSWTDTFEYRITKRLRNVEKLPKFLLNAYSFKMYGDAYFKKYKSTIRHGYDLGYIKGKHNLTIMNANVKNTYLIINFDLLHGKVILEADVKGFRIKKGEEYTLFNYYYVRKTLSELAVNEGVFNLKTNDKIFGYTSWYNHYQDINEKIVSDCLESLDSRFNLFQIDDGYETFVGDWLDIDKNKFPNGLKGLVDKAHNKGFKAGIWLAPFVAETKSKLFKDHPDWFHKDEKNKPIKCGSNWSGFYALNLKLKEVRDYIEKSLNYYIDLGFDFFKLDFLYASSVKPDEDNTRAMITAKAYGFLRRVLKDKLILGCGASIMSSAGVFDYMRIGPDVSLKFDDIWYMKFMHRERISTKVTIQNTIYRSVLDHRLFLNDPDVFLLRDDNIELSKAQRLALITINALFGSVLMTSDNIKEYDEEKNEILNNAFDIFNNAKNKKYSKDGKYIHISYDLHDKHIKYKYDTLKGVLLNDR